MGHETFKGFLSSVLLPKPAAVFRGIQIYRCQSDGQLVTKANLENHAGHMVRTPVVLTAWEKMLIWLKIIQ